MFKIFKKKYKNNILPEVSGAAKDIEISFVNFPVRTLKSNSKKHIECYSDFNVELIDAIWAHVGSFESFQKKLKNGPVSFSIKTKKSITFTCSIAINFQISKEQFRLNLPEAIIDAFERYNIGR